MKKLSNGEWIAVAVSVIFVSYSLFGSNIMSLVKGGNIDSAIAIAPEFQPQNGVITNDLVVGTGAEVKSGQLVSVHYILSLSDGMVVENSRNLGMPLKFVVGSGMILPAFESGISGAKVGGVRSVILPPELAYGSVENGPIPPNSTLIFTVEVLSAEDVQNPIQN